MPPPSHADNARKAKNPGAPIKLTEDLVRKIYTLISRGAWVETAAAANGVHKDTLYRWLKIGSQKAKGLHRALYDAVHKGAAEAEAGHVVVIEVAGKGVKGDVVRDQDGNVVLDAKGRAIVAREAKASDWKASAWFLERRFPKRWGAKQTLEHTGPDGGPIQNADVQMSEEDQKKLDKELADLRKANELTDEG